MGKSSEADRGLEVHVLSHFGADTYSLCSAVRDMPNDMLKGLPSGNRLNTHITLTPSSLIAPVRVVMVTALRNRCHPDQRG